jgi:guanylate kinase
MLVMIGSSASGKTEIAKIMIHKYQFEKMVTYTTRSKRINEVDGVDYHFITVEEFKRLNSNSEFVETTCYNDNYYGTRFKDISNNKILIVDIPGANSIYQKVGNKIVLFYLYASEETRRKRMMMREDLLEDVNKRIEKDKTHFDPSLLIRIDYLIDTEDKTLEQLAEDIYSLYTNHTK